MHTEPCAETITINTKSLCGMKSWAGSLEQNDRKVGWILYILCLRGITTEPCLFSDGKSWRQNNYLQPFSEQSRLCCFSTSFRTSSLWPWISWLIWSRSLNIFWYFRTEVFFLLVCLKLGQNNEDSSYLHFLLLLRWVLMYFSQEKNSYQCFICKTCGLEEIFNPTMVYELLLTHS